MKTNETTTQELVLDWESAFEEEIAPNDTHVESIADGLILSLSNLGRVDIKYIMDATGSDYMTVVNALVGSIFQNPDKWDGDFYKGWETADEYLSGNLRRKLRSARRANKMYPGRFSGNVFALRKLMPESAGAKDIYVTLGSPWVPATVIDSFIAHILKAGIRLNQVVNHDEYSGTWEIENKTYLSWLYSVPSRSTYGTQRMSALEILEKTLNMKTIVVYDETNSSRSRSGKKRVINQNETLLAVAKQQKMISAFQEWVWQDEKRKELLESIFESKFGCIRRRVFDGSFLKFPGLCSDIQLYPYQKNAVARILFSPNTLLAHDVGSGKTYVMIAAGMELKRMGLSKKNLYVVPNNIVMQWKNFFDKMYPSASVLVVDAKNFTPEKRDETLRAIRDTDWDAVIMAYSCFDRIPLSKSVLLDELEEAREEIRKIEEVKKLTSGLKKKRDQLNKEIAEMVLAAQKQENSLCFDELGISRLFVDEAHNYKNVPIETKTDRVLGISSGGSKKAKDMMDKVHFIQKQNNGGGVVLATGTPITNSLTEAFIMQKYLQSGELAMLDLQTFDSWVGMFAERVTEFEIDVDTNSYRLATRFSKFHNLPELTALLSSIADFHQVDECVDIPIFDGYDDSLVARSEPFAKYLKQISQRAEKVRGGYISVKEDNMLKITTDGRKAALDLRLVDDEAKFDPKSKVAKCAKNVYAIYLATSKKRSTQLVFCDTSTPKDGFNIYDELKKLLVYLGVDENEIAFVHDASTESQREKLFARVRSGEIRILIGSTFKLGMGVNVQDKLIAIHHLDIPWRPADMTQREGRILRQGNQNRKAYIFRYITEGSFDAYSWQLLETKERFISSLLEGSLSDRSGDDVDNTVLNYAEVKALAVGNPLVKERVEVSNQLSRILSLHRREIENHIRLEKELLEMPGKIACQTDLIEKCLADLKHYRAYKCVHDKDERKALRERLASAIDEHIAEMCECDTVAMTYQGFDIVLPANMSSEKPYIWLRNEGKYFVELGESSLGTIIRVDNCLEKLPEKYKEMKSDLESLKLKQTALREEISKKEDYAEKIEALKQKLERIDKKLGVTNK